MTTACLSTTYFGPVQWYQKLHRYDQVVIDGEERFLKQTYRNRCLIATTQGVQALTVPVVHDSKSSISDVFFEYYEDDLRPFFKENNWERLVDYNDAICRKVCELLDIQPSIVHQSSQDCSDFRLVINPKHPLEDSEFMPRKYYQVYQQKHGFLSNLSILDLLFNMGPESIFFL